MNSFTFLPLKRPLAIASDVSTALFKHSFAFVSHFISEEGYSILNEMFLHKRFLVSDNNFTSYYHAWLQPVSLQVVLEFFFLLLFQKMGRSGDGKRSIKLRLPNSTLALLKSQHNWLKWLDGNVDFVWIFSFDFSNAFDSVSPKILVVLVSLRYWYRSLYSELAYQFR